MLNPYGYSVASSKPADCDFQNLMKSVKVNITENEAQVQEFIAKETNEHRRRDLQTIFEQSKALKMRFDNHRMSEIMASEEFKSMASRLCTLIQKQRHAGRKLFMSSVSNPLLGFDCVTFFYYPTIRGIKQSQLSLMDDFIASLKGIKTEFNPDFKPIGMINTPKSESSRDKAGTKNLRKIKISHVDFKNDVTASLASVLTLHKVPIKWLDCNIDTSEMPNAFKKKANILINVNLVVEMTSDPIQSAALKLDDDDDDDNWSTDGWFDREARLLIEKSKSGNDSLNMTHNSGTTNTECRQNRQYGDDILVMDTTPANVFYHPDDKFLESSAASTTSNVQIPTDSGISLPTPPSASTPARPTQLPRPNDSLLSNGLPDEILNIGQIHTTPLATPRIQRRSLERSNTMGPSVMPPLSDTEDDIPQNQSLPNPASSNAIASQRDIEGLLTKLTEKFESLEKSINKK